MSQQWVVPDLRTVTRALEAVWRLSGHSGVFTVPVSETRSFLRSVHDDRRITDLPSLIAVSSSIALDTLRNSGIPSNYVALAMLESACSANGVPIDSRWRDVRNLEYLSSVLAWFDLSDPHTWEEFTGWITAQFDAGPQVTKTVVNALVVGGITGRTPEQRQTLDDEMEAVARDLSAREIRVGQAHLEAFLDRDPERISDVDCTKLRHSDLVVFVVDGPSTGLGMLAAFAHRHRCIVMVVAPADAQLPPLLVGMSKPHTLIQEAASPDRLAAFRKVLDARVLHVAARRDMRDRNEILWSRARGTLRNAVESRGGAIGLPLPPWFSRARLVEILSDTPGYLSATTDELWELSITLGLDWSALCPRGNEPRIVGLRPAELLAAAQAQQVGNWDHDAHLEILNRAAGARETEGLTRPQGDVVRARLDLSDAEAWLRFVDKHTDLG